jgi:hypothetical protein
VADLSRTTTPDGHLEKFRVFPLYAHEERAAVREADGAVADLDHARYVHPKAEGTAWVLFPLAGG